jgi:hypothetical protein
MLSGFFDDSGKESDPSNKIVCAAGYIAASPNLWQGFHEMWNNFLLKHGIDELHMKEMMCTKSTVQPFASWDWPKKKAVLEDFSMAIKVSQIIGFGVAVDADAWRELLKANLKDADTAQEFCFLRLIRIIVDRLKKSAPKETVSIMFDTDEGFTPSRFKRFLHARKRVPDDGNYLASFGVGEPKIFLPLQAADFLAWETRTELLRKSKGFDCRPELLDLMKVLPGFFPDYTGEYWDREKIQSTLNPEVKGRAV